MMAEKRTASRHQTTKLSCMSVAALMCVLCMCRGVLAQQSSTVPSSAASIDAEQLRAGFEEPPPSARLRCYWWWLNGNTDKPTITHDLEEMKAKGFGGALLIDANGSNLVGNRDVPAGPAFGSAAWVDLYTHALREADRLGLEITLNITSGWNLGGPDVQPEQASKLLTWTRTQVSGGSRVELKLPAPATKNGFYRSIAVLAYPLRHGVALATQPAGPPLRARSAAVETGFSMPDATPMLDAGDNPDDTKAADTSLADVQNLSAQMRADGTLAWDVPAGEWEVLWIGYTDSDARVSTSSNAWQGLAIDYLSRDAFNTYWHHTVEPLLDAAKPYHSLKYLATDSWELGGTNWTQTFAEEFRKRRGYDPVPWLPVVAGRIVGDHDRSIRFLADLRRTVADLVVSNHYDVFAARAAEYGLGVQAESGGPHGAPIDALETFRHSAVPQSEFWSENPHRSQDVERFFTKEAASAAHIYGQHFVAQEGETSIGRQWSESLATDLKPTFDMAVTEGMNRLVWHQFTSSPADTGMPGQEYFAGTHLNPKVTWWNAGEAFFRYLNRVQFIMQQGIAVNDALYFYGDNVPAFVRMKADDPAHVLPGYDYDVTDEDALLHTLRRDGSEIVGPSGSRWRALVLPASGRMSLPALLWVEQYVRGGGIAIGNPPSSPTGIFTADDVKKFSSTVAAVWGEGCTSQHAYGSGQVYCTRDAHAALQQMRVLPDVEVLDGGVQSADSHTSFDYVHRRIGRSDVYFVRNASATASLYDVTFRAQATTVELWDAVDGEMHVLSDAARLPDGRTRVRMKLPPFGSAFLVFGLQPTRGETALPVESRSVPLVPDQPWSITFEQGRGAPVKPVSVTTLASWTDSSDPGIRFFSGTATYKTTVAAPVTAPGQQVLLHFTDVREIARVRVNGQYAGTVWATPLTLRVDPWLKPGRNTLEIEVTNLWPNRIIGDQQPGTPQRFTETNITAYRADSPLLPSGLIGPLEWILQK
jgi:hypothetical protein